MALPIIGTGKANPTAVLSGALMLDFLNENKPKMKACVTKTQSGTTTEISDAIAAGYK